MGFFRKLVNPNDGTVSSKTFVGLVSFLMVLIYAVVDITFDVVINETIFFGLLGLITACFGLNTIINSRKIDSTKPGDVNVENAKNVNVDSKNNPNPTAPNNVTLEENEIIG